MSAAGSAGSVDPMLAPLTQWKPMPPIEGVPVSSMQVSPFTSWNRVLHPSAFAAARLWYSAVAARICAGTVPGVALAVERYAAPVPARARLTVVAARRRRRLITTPP